MFDGWGKLSIAKFVLLHHCLLVVLQRIRKLLNRVLEVIFTRLTLVRVRVQAGVDVESILFFLSA